jgi:hypothetical protein
MGHIRGLKHELESSITVSLELSRVKHFAKQKKDLKQSCASLTANVVLELVVV